MDRFFDKYLSCTHHFCDLSKIQSQALKEFPSLSHTETLSAPLAVKQLGEEEEEADSVGDVPSTMLSCSPNSSHKSQPQ